MAADDVFSLCRKLEECKWDEDYRVCGGVRGVCVFMAKTQRRKDTETQLHRYAKTQRRNDTDTQRLRDATAPQRRKDT